MIVSYSCYYSCCCYYYYYYYYYYYHCDLFLFRTARGFDYGTALTFVSPAQESLLEELQDTMNKCSGEWIEGYAVHIHVLYVWRYIKLHYTSLLYKT